jgi:hypothetical protein
MEDEKLLAVVLVPVPLLAIMERLIMLVLITGLSSGLLVLADKMRDKGRLENDSNNRQWLKPVGRSGWITAVA